MISTLKPFKNFLSLKIFIFEKISKKAVLYKIFLERKIDFYFVFFVLFLGEWRGLRINMNMKKIHVFYILIFFKKNFFLLLSVIRAKGAKLFFVCLCVFYFYFKKLSNIVFNFPKKTKSKS